MSINGSQILEPSPNALELISKIAGVDAEMARNVLTALAKNGYVIAPLEPTNSMFDAYIRALKQPAKDHKVIIENVGKARKRWKAMALAGMQVAFSRESGLEST